MAGHPNVPERAHVGVELRLTSWAGWLKRDHRATCSKLASAVAALAD